MNHRYEFGDDWCRVYDNGMSTIKKVEAYINEKLQAVGLVLDEDYYFDRPACTNKYFQIKFKNEDAVLGAKLTLE